MASSEEYKVILKRYKEEGLPKGIPIERFCSRNGIVFSNFARWYKQRIREKRVKPEIHEVRALDSTDPAYNDETTYFSAIITTNHWGPFRVTRQTYEQFKNIVKNLEILC